MISKTLRIIGATSICLLQVSAGAYAAATPLYRHLTTMQRIGLQNTPGGEVYRYQLAKELKLSPGRAFWIGPPKNAPAWSTLFEGIRASSPAAQKEFGERLAGFDRRLVQLRIEQPDAYGIDLLNHAAQEMLAKRVDWQDSQSLQSRFNEIDYQVGRIRAAIEAKDVSLGALPSRAAYGEKVQAGQAVLERVLAALEPYEPGGNLNSQVILDESYLPWAREDGRPSPLRRYNELRQKATEAQYGWLRLRTAS